MQVVRGNGNMFMPAAVSKPNAPVSPAVSGGIAPNIQGAAGSFGDILARKVDESNVLQFSKHAELRLKSRDIKLSGEQLSRAAEGVERAKAKGIRDSLVLIDDVALVVNTKSSIVITAMESGSENIFTNIDGAVIV